MPRLRVPKIPTGRNQLFSMTLDQSKSWFFDTSELESIFRPAHEKALSLTGFTIMRNARRNIRKRKKPSKPGQSPSRWGRQMVDQPGIQYVQSADGYSVLVGPMKFKSKSKTQILGGRRSIPEVLEKGGYVYEPYGTLTRYGAYLGPRTVGIAPRPYMSKALKQSRRKISKLFTDYIDSDPRVMQRARTLAAKYGDRAA